MSAGGEGATKKAALLEEFAEACTIVARGLAPKDHDIQWENGKDGFVHFHCPIPGLNGPHTWTGAPRACAWVKGDQVEAWCTKCVGDKKTYHDQATYDAARATYTDQVKRAIRWEQDGVVHAGFKTITVRSHLYFDRDFKHAIRRDKVRYEDGRKEKGNANPWRWRVAEMANGQPGPFSPMRAEPWLAANYPEHDVIYNALCWYSIDLFIDPAGIGAPTASTIPLKLAYRMVLTEGEHDADTFNMLMAAAGNADNIATCLCHPKPTKLASHHARLVAGRDVVIVGDADDPGKDQAENWASILWGQPNSVKIVRDQLGLAGTPDDKDLTDWVVKRLGPPEAWLTKLPTAKAVAAELLDLFASTAPLMEPPGRPTEWRSDMIESKGGAPKADSPHNAERVWTMHPALMGKVRTNTRSGEVEVIDPPWGGGVVVGARRAALDCGMWLEKTEKLSLSTRILEDVLTSDRVAPPHNPLQDLLDSKWDGVPRLDGLFTTYVPLKVPPAEAVMFARTMLEDLVRKMRNEFVGQRVLIGIETGLDVDVAGALMGRHGCQHRGKVGERDATRFARQEALLVQISQDPVANRQASIHSIPHIFTFDTYVAQRRLSSPLYVAVGTAPVDDRTKVKIDERVFRFPLVGRARLDDLREDAPQIIAEAVAMVDGYHVVVVPDRDELRTVDRLEILANVHAVVTALWLFVTRDVEGVDLLNPRALAMADERAEPRRHIVRDQFIQVMKVAIAADFREDHTQARAFNAMCRAFGWSLAVGITTNIANHLGISIGGKSKTVLVGVLMTDERLNQLRDHLFPDAEDDDLPPPKGGGQPEPKTGDQGDSDAPEVSDRFASVCEPVCPLGNPWGLSGLLEATAPIELSQNEIVTPAHVTRYKEETKGPGWIEGPEAVARAKSILSVPGWCAIDFETWPTAASWHGDDAAEKAPRGSKGEARAEATLAAQMGGRAKQRRACTLQLHHECGAEVFIRLTPGDDPEPRRVELRAMFEGRISDLCAHNAQFEIEVLLNHGVAADVECTLLAAKALYLTAVADDQPQPVSFGLAALVAKEFPGRTRDKAIRNRDWRLAESLDDEAIEYGMLDARDCLALWQHYQARLEKEGLLEGYQVMQRALLPTAATNLAGLILDATAHAALMQRMSEDADNLEAELGWEAMGEIENHGSSQQVSTWIQEQILGAPIKIPVEPKLVGLADFLVDQGGLRPIGELRDAPKRLIVKRGKRGLGLDEAANLAMQAGYIGRMRDYGQLETDVEDADPDELVRAIERDLAGDRVLTLEDDAKWQGYLAAKEDFDQRHKDDPYQAENFEILLRAKIGIKGWRRTKTGHLAITKGAKMRKAEQLAEVYPVVSRYLVKHAQWTKATKLIESFGPTLRRWQDDDGRCRGQFRVWAAWTGRQSCVDPNLQNQPRESEFRALWIAPPERKLVIADYSQIELRLLAIESGDERLREVYREGRDVHAETAAIAYHVDEPDKEQRRMAKAINFGIAYGSGASGLAEHGGFELAEAQMILARVLGAYPGLADYRERMPAEAKARGYIEIRPNRHVLCTPDTPGTACINAPIQGGAASVQMRALRLLHDALTARPDLDSFTVASVHDEFLVEAPADHRADEVAALLADSMVRALLEIYPSAEDMGMHRLTAAAACDRWSERP